MGIEEVSGIIHKIAVGLAPACAQCLDVNKGIVLDAVREQIYSGLDGDGQHLSPTYDDDPYFEEEGFWFHRSNDYKSWKHSITPPEAGLMLGLPPRPENVPNLFINGKFFSEITATLSGDKLVIDPGANNGPSIVAKYGDRMLHIGETAVGFFNDTCMLPAIEELYEKSGYK